MYASQTDHSEIISYYDSCEWDYRIVWSTDSSLSLHYGFWTPGVQSLKEAQLNQNRWLADRVRISSSDRVLDAGCGIGGSSIYLSYNRGCHCTGISLSHRQVEKAHSIASHRNISNIAFEVQDFTRTSFPDHSFSVVWAIESVCHAGDKSAFLREAFRLLRPGGRLIVADGFSQIPIQEMTTAKKELMRGWLEPWAVDSLATMDEFASRMQLVGFEHIEGQDVTELMRPSARILNRRARIATVPANLMRWTGLRNKIQHGNYLAGKYQWRALNANLWQYAVFSAVRPGPGKVQ